MCSQLTRLFVAAAFCGAHAIKMQQDPGKSDLVFVHTPFNFGHTIENVALFGQKTTADMQFDWIRSMGGFSHSDGGLTWDKVYKVKQPEGYVWGHNSPDLQGNSSVGCPYYYTPQKYWEKELQEKYIGNKKVFGVLRDPYEHLTALYRGHVDGYGADASDNYFDTCEINDVMKKSLKAYLAGDRFASGCTFLPQAEFFEGPYGISVPIDNRRFPDSANEVFEKEGSDLRLTGDHVLHVVGCQNAWTGDLDAETKSMIRQIYHKDFELLCKHFGYCDDQEDTCLTHIPAMCPLTHYKWVWDNSTGLAFGGQYIKKKTPSPPTAEEKEVQREVSARFNGYPLDIRGVGEKFQGYILSCDSEMCHKQKKEIETECR